jgi:predicted dehydrogenase
VTPVPLDPRPRFPEDPLPGVAIVGAGRIVRTAHLEAYRKYGVPVVGSYSRSATPANEGAGRRFDSLDDLLAASDVDVVDVATPPAPRVEIIRRALDAGKHVLAQKPLAPDLANARALVDLAERRGLRLAVNQNARWAPAWRVATLLVQNGAIGEVLAVTHLHEEHNRWLIGSHFDEVEHWLLFDFMVHWLDVTRCWFEGKRPESVSAREYRTPGQPSAAKEPWAGIVDVAYPDGSSAVIRSVGCSETPPRFPFWIHGAAGTISGQIATGEYVELERDGMTTRFPLSGTWTPDGFAGTMGELMCAIAENREPYNSARHNLLSLEMTLAACASAEKGGQPISIERDSEN